MPFLVLGILFFLMSTIACYVNTLVYAIYVIPHPAWESLAFGVGMLVDVYIVFAILVQSGCHMNCKLSSAQTQASICFLTADCILEIVKT